MGKTKPGWTSIKSTADGAKFVNIESLFINKQNNYKCFSLQMEAEVVIHIWNGIKKAEYYGIHFNILSLESGWSLLHSDVKASAVLRFVTSLWTYS